MSIYIYKTEDGTYFATRCSVAYKDVDNVAIFKNLHSLVCNVCDFGGNFVLDWVMHIENLRMYKKYPDAWERIIEVKKFSELKNLINTHPELFI